jgi:ABC-type transport system involved in cytochrome c biogenesis ATPase subunit
MDPVIRTSGLTKRYRGRPALTDLDLAVPRGGVFGYLGPNGAGKTTTIRLLAGLLRPTAGRAEVLGRDVVRDREGAQRHIGYLPGEFVAYPDLTAGQYLRYLGNLRGGVAPSRALPVLFLVYGIGRGARAVAGEEEAGTLDVLLVTRVSPARLVLARARGRGVDRAAGGGGQRGRGGGGRGVRALRRRRAGRLGGALGAAVAVPPGDRGRTVGRRTAGGVRLDGAGRAGGPAGLAAGLRPPGHRRPLTRPGPPAQAAGAGLRHGRVEKPDLAGTAPERAAVSSENSSSHLRRTWPIE